MHYQLKKHTTPETKAKTAQAILLTVSQTETNSDTKKTQSAPQLAAECRTRLPSSVQTAYDTAVKTGLFQGVRGQIFNHIDPEQHSYTFIGIGTHNASAQKMAQIAGKTISQHCQHYELTRAELWLTDEQSQHIAAFVQASEEAAYIFTAPKGMDTGKHAATQNQKHTANDKRKLTLCLSHTASPEQKQQLAQAQAISQGIHLAKQLGNTPPNYATPSHLGNVAKQLAKDYDFKVQVLEQKQIAALKMNAFLSVAKGSSQAPRFIVLEYHGTNQKTAPTVLVGKGITFDSGGISLKPGAGMDEMKYDMCGAASVLGTFKALGELKPKINVVGLIAACENMPAGNANKPGDVVTSMKGLTIEILNTDAEGRLILCDALTYAERYQPSAVVNMATLTGACVVALGHHHAGLFANNDTLAEEIQTAGQTQTDTVWRMPLDSEYSEQLKSNFADLANIGGMPAGSVTAACFLSKFTEAYPWAHLDIAGVAWKTGANKGATGRPVALLSQFLLNRAAT